MNIGVATAVRKARKTMMAFGLAAIALPAAAQVVPDDQTVPTAGLNLPSNLQIFGKSDPNVRKPTAIVNGFVITGTDVDHRASLIIALNNLTLSPEEKNQLRLQILRQLIDETLQIQAAAADKITIDKAEIDQSFARFSRSTEKTPDQMRAWLRQIGSSERSIKRQIEGEIAWNRVLRRRVDINVSEAEVNAMLDRLRKIRGTDEYHFFEIYMSATPDRAQEVFAAQQRIIEQMKQGQPFDYLARVNSEASTKSKGGDLGWVRLAMLPEQLQAVGSNMGAGQVAGPIEIPGGFSILYLAEKRQVMSSNPRQAKLSLKQLTITFAPGTTEAQATSRAAQFAEATASMQGCGDAERVARLVGAEVVANDTMRIGDLPPALQDIMLPLQVGQATQPFGSIDQGVRVLALCGRDDPPEFVEPSVEQMQERIAEERTNLRAQRMLRDLRRDALIEYR